MTPRQRQVMDAITYLSDRGVSPSMREIAAHVGIGVSHVHRIVDSLESHGRLRREGDRRGLIVIGDFDEERIARMPHADLLALRAIIDRRLGA